MKEIPFISCPIGGEDHDLFAEIVNQGIDSRLEGFTESKFIQNGNRLDFFFADSEIPILMRRLSELASEGNYIAEDWEIDILDVEYNAECR